MPQVGIDKSESFYRVFGFSADGLEFRRFTLRRLIARQRRSTTLVCGNVGRQSAVFNRLAEERLMSSESKIGALPKGQRNDGLARLAGSLRRKGMQLAEIEAKLLAANDRRCEPPLSDNEVRTIAASVARYEAGGPDPLEQAFAATEAEYPSKYLQFLALCNYLQNERRDLSIALPLKRIASLFDCNWTRVQQFRHRAVKDGMLKLANDYIPHRLAATYFFVPNSSTTTRTSSSLWLSTSLSAKSPGARSTLAACTSPNEQRVLRLAARGFRLFPCRPRSKVPLLKAWPQKATCDSAEVRNWLRKNPDVNWACATGEASGVWVLDIDGADALAAILHRFKEHNYFPETLCTRTGRENGYHLYFIYPRDGRIRVGNRARIKNWHRDLDVRGEGGYVMVPPSLWSDDKAALEGRKPLPLRPYRFLRGDDHPIAKAPDWLLEIVGTADGRTT